MTRRNRARDVLAAYVDIAGISDEIRDGENPVYDLSPEMCVDAMLAFADAELERAAISAESIKRLVPYEYNSQPCATTMKRISSLIRAMKESE